MRLLFHLSYFLHKRIGASTDLMSDVPAVFRTKMAAPDTGGTVPPDSSASVVDSFEVVLSDNGRMKKFRCHLCARSFASKQNVLIHLTSEHDFSK